MIHSLRRVVVRVTMLIFLLSGSGIWEALAVPLTDVSFSDPPLQECVQRMAQARGWTNTEEVTSLMCSHAGIVSMSGLEVLGNLARLNLGNNQINDLTPIASLTNLTVVLLDFNSIDDLTPIAGLTNLTSLDVSFNGITDLTPIAGLTNLTGLGVSANYIVDLNPLTGLTNLTFLFLDDNLIFDINPVLPTGTLDFSC
jgi:Leucine Rich repeats (2 copies)